MKINLITTRKKRWRKVNFASSQIRKRYFLDVLYDLDRYAHLDFYIKIHTVSGGSFLRHRLLKGCY